MISKSAVVAELAVGELIDKITILDIKSERISNQDKLTNIRRERDILNRVRLEHVAPSPQLDALQSQLKRVNEEIWELEDQIREFERNKDFGEAFVRCAREIYRTNDRRANTKREINELVGSELVEEKSYAAY